MPTQPPAWEATTAAWVKQHFEPMEGETLTVDDVIEMTKNAAEFRGVNNQTLRSRLRQCFETTLEVTKRKNDHGNKAHFVGVARKRPQLPQAHEEGLELGDNAADIAADNSATFAAKTAHEEMQPADEHPADSPAAVARCGDKLQITSTVSRPFKCPICFDDFEKST